MAENKILNHNPLGETDAILRKEYYGQVGLKGDSASAPVGKKKEKPSHYKVICISMYNPDIENLDAMVAELKRRGHTKANKSQLIRYALRQIDVDKVPLPTP